MHGAAGIVDVEAVGFVTDDDDICAQLFEYRGGDFVSGAVGTVDDDALARQAQGTGKRVFDVDDVAADDIIDPFGFPDLLVGFLPGFNGGIVLIDGFDLLFHFAAEFVSVGVKKFDPIVVVFVVARRDHDARIASHAFGEKRDRRSRHGADLDHIIPHGSEAGDDGVFDHVAAAAGVFAHQDTVGARLGTEIDPCSHRQTHGGRGAYFGAGFAPDTIGSKKFHVRSFKKKWHYFT